MSSRTPSEKAPGGEDEVVQAQFPQYDGWESERHTWRSICGVQKCKGRHLKAFVTSKKSNFSFSVCLCSAVFYCSAISSPTQSSLSLSLSHTYRPPPCCSSQCACKLCCTQQSLDIVNNLHLQDGNTARLSSSCVVWLWMRAWLTQWQSVRPAIDLFVKYGHHLNLPHWEMKRVPPSVVSDVNQTTLCKLIFSCFCYVRVFNKAGRNPSHSHSPHGILWRDPTWCIAGCLVLFPVLCNID